MTPSRVEVVPSDVRFVALGGSVEFGEHSRDAVVREFEEELGVTFAAPDLAGTFERVFTFVEPEFGTEHLARWVPVERLRDDGTTFYAPEVLDALDAGERSPQD